MSGAEPAVLIRVKDSGVGISVQDIGKIFEPFEQARSTAGTTEKKGTGLGLSIARWIAEMHGGRLDVVSEVDRGSEFIIRLPMAEGQRCPDSTTAVQDEPRDLTA